MLATLKLVKMAKNGKCLKVSGRQQGFESYVGMTLMPFARFAEGSPAASYERIQKQLEGQAFLSAFESLRGGGAIANAEGQQATAALFRANKAQSEVEYIKAIREAQYHARRAVEAARKSRYWRSGACDPWCTCRRRRRYEPRNYVG
jgi:hypothetical protein